MSRYVRAAIELANLDEVAAALTALAVPFVRAEAVMLRGSIECTGEPVQLRCEAGTADAVEDFGFCVDEGGRVELVCGEIDRALLEEQLVPELLAATVKAKVADVPGVRVVVKKRLT